MTTNANDTTFTKINPQTLDPQLQALYKEMQGDYTRKMQEVAKIRETAETGQSQLSGRVAELEDALRKGQAYVQQLERNNQELSGACQQWEQYVKQTLTPVGQATPTGKTVSRDPDADPNDEQPAGRGRMVVGPDGKVFEMADPVQTLQARIKQLEDSIQQTAAKTGSQLNIVTQMSELTRKYGGKSYFDPKAVLKTALDRGINDMEEAYERTYAKELQDELVAAEVERQVKERLAAQNIDPLASRPGNIGPTTYTPSKETGDTYDAINQEFLAELARGEV